MKLKKLETGNNASIITYKGLTPKIDPSVFLCEGVKIIGDVTIGENSSIWYNTVIRGDVHYINIGKGVNIQDLSMLHVTNQKHPLNIMDYASVGHSVNLHGCTLNSGCLIGIGATVLDRAVIGKNSLVGAGAVVKEGFKVPEGTLVAGVPAKIIKELNENELERVTSTAQNYINYSKEFRDNLKK
ncbi:gamma carbonic anhydrase family protein [Candidatus Kapabacteria bacterium]|nr:gamma carbonic anhydrase family protein [Candidatus Kapabacteria bacterium]